MANTTQKQSDPFGFMSALVGNSKPVAKRIHAEMPDGTVGITAWYTDATIGLLAEEILERGGLILKIETSTEK